MVKIYTLADKRPDFIEMQIKSIRKYLTGDYEYIVIDNAIDSPFRSKVIKEICSDLNVKYVKITLEDDLNNLSDGKKCYSGNAYVTPNTAHLYPMMWIFKKLIQDKETSFVIDSDMFFLSKIDISELSKSDLLYMPQYRGSFEYIAPSLLVLNTEGVDNFRDIDWDFVHTSNGATDVGGKTNDFLQRNSNIRKEYFEQYSIYDVVYNGEYAKIHLILNGNSNYEIIENFTENKLISIKNIGTNNIGTNRTFTHEEPSDDYHTTLYNGYLKIKNMLDFNIVNPIHTGFIRKVGHDDFIILHYQTGSNYANFSTDDYNLRKTSLVRNIINID